MWAILTVIVFINAALLFSVEPMFSKLVLPYLGGSPNVWNTCLVFFQATLLLGYCYAHLSLRLLGIRKQAVLHILLLVLACVFLPLQIRPATTPPLDGTEVFWLIGVLSASLGAPFVMLASGAPLAQRWFASMGDSTRSPYSLYAASNLGSMCALLSYPFLVEPMLPLSTQRLVWSFAYVSLVLLIGGTLWLVLTRQRVQTIGGSLPQDAPTPPITARDRGRWILYSAVPSSLLLGVTTYISTDVAAVPLLWVLPLSVYLLTFVLVFAQRPPVSHSLMVRAEPYLIIVVALLLFWDVTLRGLLPVALHVLLLFVVAMVCHGELARWRPDAGRLTEFFVWVSVGGLVGGVFNSLIAPRIFSDVSEYPIAIAIAALLRPSRSPSSPSQRTTDLLIAAAFGTVLALTTWGQGAPPELWPALIMIVAAVAAFSTRDRPLRFALVLTAILIVGEARRSHDQNGRIVLRAERSFFGVYRVLDEEGKRLLIHGTTVHGAQSRDATHTLEPLSYYHRVGPIGDVFGYTPAGLQSSRRVAIVGLGTGSLACYGHPNELWTFYEIDPLVARIASNPRLFTFVRDCPPAVKVVLGDARLTLSSTSSASYDVLVLDAFSSDAIPVHLLTREALQRYLSILAPNGIIAIHISNLHMDLEPVVAALARDSRLSGRIRRDLVVGSSDAATGRSPSIWTVLARTDADLGPLDTLSTWGALQSRSNVAVWTDDFSNVIRVLKWR